MAEDIYTASYKDKRFPDTEWEYLKYPNYGKKLFNPCSKDKVPVVEPNKDEYKIFCGSNPANFNKASSGKTYSSYEEAYSVLVGVTFAESSKYYVIRKNEADCFKPCAYIFVPRVEPSKEKAEIEEENWLTKYGEEEAKIYPSTIEETKMAAKNAFRVVAVLHVRPTKDTAGNDTTEDSKLIYDQLLIAGSNDSAKLIAAKKFAAKLSDEEISRVQVAITPIL